LEDALEHGLVVLSPIVIAELVSGARGKVERKSITELVDELPVHDTPIDHWVRVGDLRRTLLDRGLSVSTRDAHVAQCALDRDALLFSRDTIFARIGRAVVSN
jgi:tRNA(fMet)-specific endonuclease VapC